jgi:YidC/Oxa1 family membrane protein insertase
MTTSPGGGGGQGGASMTQSMTMMMPLMFGFFSLNFSPGLSFYFVVSNVIGIITQGFISGWQGLLFWKGFSLTNLLGGGRQAQPAPSKQESVTTTKATPIGSPKGSTSGKKKRKKKRRRKR